jgi:hypothetical protein
MTDFLRQLNKTIDDRIKREENKRKREDRESKRKEEIFQVELALARIKWQEEQIPVIKQKILDHANIDPKREIRLREDDVRGKLTYDQFQTSLKWIAEQIANLGVKCRHEHNSHTWHDPDMGHCENEWDVWEITW